jgi:hypothetical protein
MLLIILGAYLSRVEARDKGSPGSRKSAPLPERFREGLRRAPLPGIVRIAKVVNIL